MAEKLKVVLNREGVRQLLRSADMMAACEQKANEALAQLGAGYQVTTHTGRNRVNASIAAVTAEAIRENAETNSVLKALK